jgi:hypothetical protein
MQPCPNCGRTELTPAGNCQNCGLFRGHDGYGTASPSYAQGYTSPVDPFSAAPYPADPYSAPPHQGQQPYQGQSYEQPYQGYQQHQAPPQYGYQDPNAYQAAPMPAPRRPSTVPLIVLSVIAVILVIGIVGVVVVRADGSGDNGNGNGNNANGNNANGNTGTNAAGIDKCVIGTWRITSAKEKVELEGSLTEFTARGGTVELKSDGTGKIDYGSGVTYTGTVSGQSVNITFTGSVTYSFKTSDGSFTFSNVSPNGTATVKINGVTTTTIPLDMDTKPSKYECSGDTMTQSTDLATVEMSK